MNKYSIWLVPEECEKRSVQDIINSLLRTYGGDVFTPHLTILGEINGEETKIKKIFTDSTKGFHSLEIFVDRVTFSTTFFQNVFILAKPTSDLLELNLNLKKRFDMPNDFFIPHISLMYGLEDMKLREEISEKIQFKEKSILFDKIVLVDLANSIKDMKIICEKVG